MVGPAAGTAGVVVVVALALPSLVQKGGRPGVIGLGHFITEYFSQHGEDFMTWVNLE